jgi:adenylate cyclase class 2
VPRNVELKARLADLGRARAVAVALGARPEATLGQIDRYYELAGGRRLKLRTCPGRTAELIRYERPETTGIRTSHWQATPVHDTAEGVCLVPRTPPLVVVRKQREVLRLDNVRIHLDRVEGLGTFLELEAVVDAAHDEVTCRRRIDEISRSFGLGTADLIRASYADLLRAR